MNGFRRLAFAVRIMAPTHFVVQRHPSSIRPPGISEQFKFCSATPRLRTQSGTLAEGTEI